MTAKDWIAAGGTTLLVFTGWLVAFLSGRAEKRGQKPPVAIFTKSETAYWAIGMGALMLLTGAFVADSQDVQTYVVSVGASVLGGGVVAALSV